MSVPIKEQSYTRKKLLKVLLALFFIFSVSALHAQETTEQQDQNMPTDTKAQKALAKKMKERKKQQDKATKAALKAHLQHQTPEVRKRMKADAHKANMNNEHKGEGFFYKLFHHKNKGTPSGTKPPETSTQ
jgi:hypothetical protein